MECPGCKHVNSEESHFCENCGTKLAQTDNLEMAAETVAEASVPQTAGKDSNPFLQAIKSYFSYFLQVLSKPYVHTQDIGDEHFIRAIITIVLYALFIPLMVYFGVKSFISEAGNFGGGMFNGALTYSPPFADFVLKPAFAYIVFILLIAAYLFFCIKLGGIDASYKAVITRFGGFLIPFVAIFAIALLLSIVRVKFFLFLLVSGFLVSIFTIPPLVISSFKKDGNEGLDTVYGTLITCLLTLITLGIMANILLQPLKEFVNVLFGGTFTGV